jgi:multimeric flavodoxin WrbA
MSICKINIFPSSLVGYIVYNQVYSIGLCNMMIGKSTMKGMIGVKICILSGTPKSKGLSHSVIKAAKQGVVEAGGQVDEVRLCDTEIERCKVCGNGWGACVTGECEYGDDGFNEIKERVKDSDAIIIATPVYWGETSEALKSFLDRLRRYDYHHKEVLVGKQVLLIAVAGGSGNGILTCLEQMERFCRHANAYIFDYIGVNRWNNDYKKQAVKEASFALASGRKNGDTVKY